MEKKHCLYFEVPGEPIAQQRHRTIVCHGKKVNYNPNAKEKSSLKNWFFAEMHNRALNELIGPISVKMTFHIGIPDSLSKKRRDELLGKPCAKRPDIDNYQKFYFDVMNEIVYKDDNQITTVECSKLYSIEPKTIIWCIEDNIANK